MNPLQRLALVVLILGITPHSRLVAEEPLVRNKTQLEEPQNHGGFMVFAFSPDGETLAGGTGVIELSFGSRRTRLGGEVLLWNARSGELLKTLGQHGDSVGQLAFLADGRILVSASRGNGIVKVWRMPAGRLLRTLKIDTEEKSTNLRWPHLAISDNGQTLVTINSRRIPLGDDSHLTTGGTLAVWDLQSGEKRWSKDESDAYAAALSPDGRGLVTAQRAVTDMRTDDRGRTRFRTQHTLQSWHATTGDVLHTVDLGRTATPEQIVLLDGDTVALFTGVGLSLRDRLSGESSHEIKWHQERSFGVAYLSSNGKAVGRAQPGWIEVVDVATGQSLGLMTTEFPNHLWNVAFSPDLTRAAGQDNSADGSPVVLDLEHQPVHWTERLQPGLRVTYFDDMRFQNEVARDVVREPLHFEWKAAPISQLPDDRWSCRYEGFLLIKKPGQYEFHLKTDDGSRLYLDGEQVIDNWGNHAIRQRSAKISLTAGHHPVRIDYYEHIKDAHMRFLWTDPKVGREVPVPTKMLCYDPWDRDGNESAAE